MAGKVKEFQTIVMDEPSFKDVIGGDLVFVEVFQSWAGPCECIKPLLWRTSLDNEEIKFCCAAADKISSLKEYKDKLKPVFLFYKKGALKKSIEGVNTPEIQKLLDNI